MPLNEFHQKCDLLMGHLEVFMRNFFETVTAIEDDCNLPLNTQITDLKMRLQEVELINLENSLTLSVFSSIIENFKLQKNSHNLRKLIEDLEDKNQSLELQSNVLLSEVKSQTIDELNSKFTSLLNNHLDGKNKRAM
jgi:hypothetical protein